MCPLKQFVSAFVLILSVIVTASAQDSSNSNVNQTAALTITVAATGDRVRITAPSSIVQMHVEVYAASGEKLFDQEIRGGNIFDWHLQDGQAQRLASGAYVCVVTAKSVSGRITQKLGTVTVAEKSASVQAGSQQLSLQQTQAIGPVEADSSWTIAGENEPQTPTVIANDGAEGQMIRGRGALTFRVGNFFSGVDTEQMRLTEAGDLGIGTSQPQSKLEVAGTIRAQRFLVVKPTLGNGDKIAATQASDAVDGVQPLVAGTGTQNQIAKWTDSAGTLGDSVITETPAGKVGVGITSPLSKLHVNSSFDALRLTSTNDTTPVWAQFNTSLGSGLGYFGVEGNTPGTFLAGTLPYATAVSSGGSGTALQLGSAGSVKMTILSNGNVGIGTVAPGAKLDVLGNINTSTQYNIGGNRILGNPGTNNLFAGVGAGNSNTSGNSNTFVGREAGFNNMAGLNNSFFGRAAGVSNTSGNNNSFMGLFAGLSTTEGNNNSFMGSGAGLFNTDGSDNSFFGSGAGQSSTGNSNTFIGTHAGQTNTTGNSNTIIGANANVGAPNLTNATAIGAGAVVNNSFTTVISGSTTVLSGSNIQVPSNLYVGTLRLQSGLGTTGASVCFSDPIDFYSLVGQCVSSRRYKTNIARLGFGLDLVRRLRPITFDWKEGGKHDLGLIAEDVAAIEPLLVTYDSKGQVQGVKYDRVGVVLVNAVQEQQAQIAQQQHTIENLQRQNAQMKVRNAETAARLVWLETVVTRMTHHQRHQRRRS